MARDREPIKIVYRASEYVVREFYRYACTPCLKGWDAGTIKRPQDGGEPCAHGRGMWAVGRVGPRGGWWELGPHLDTLPGAILLADAASEAVHMPPTGVK
jgi:hypothetical protein